jgi:anaerobic magnesium-protoporphyrin IX monomethyl ester cyclase
MKVLIINPPGLSGLKYVREGRCEQRLNSFQYVMVPISLPLIAGLLESKGHEVKILDCVAVDMDVTELAKELEAFEPGLAVFNMSTATSEEDMKVVDLMRPHSKAHFTAIGNHVTSLPGETLEACGLDSVVRREPEWTTDHLALCLSEKKPLTDVLGLSFKKPDGKIVHNEDRPLNEDLDSLPFPARHLLDNKLYTLPVINEPYTLVVSSRGCPHSCIYCTAHQYYGRKVRLRSPGNVVDEIQQSFEKHGIKNFTMWSDTFNIDREFALGVCAEIVKRGLHKKIRWMSNGRVDRVDAGLMKAMKESGCIGISFGIESGSDEILKNIRKGADAATARKAVKITKEAGIEVLAHVILGLPGETVESIRNTVKYIKELDPDYAQFYCAIPFPKTELEAQAKREGWKIAGGFSRFELNQPILELPTLKLEDLTRERSKAYREFYLRPSYMWGRLRKCRNPRDIYLLFRQGFDFVKYWVLNPPKQETKAA